MPRGQFRTRLTREEMICGARMLESGVSQRHGAGILNAL